MINRSSPRQRRGWKLALRTMGWTLVVACWLLTAVISMAGTVYIPPEGMWDTWVMQDGDDYHLFFLSGGNIGRAVSKDLIHWQHLPPIKKLGKKGGWDESGMMMTGSTVKHGDKYYLCFGSRAPGNPIGLIESTDLKTWKRVGNKPVLVVKEPYSPENWRDLAPLWDPKKKQWDGYLYGTHAKTKRPSIAYATSKDFINWEYHEPVFIAEKYERFSKSNKGFVNLEVPDLFEIDGKWYFTFSSIRTRKPHTSGREDASGTWYIMADKKEGPYRVPENPLLLGTGMGRFDHYVGRNIVYKGQRLLYHQNWGELKVDWSTPKMIKREKKGDLYLQYWPELDKLKTKALVENGSLKLVPRKDMQYGEQDLKKGGKFGDFMLTCDIKFEDAESLTIVWRKVFNRRNPLTKYGLKIEPKTGRFSIVEHEHRDYFFSDTHHLYEKDRYTNKELCTDTIKLRLMVRKGRSEVYINDRWIFNVGLKDIQPQGGISAVVDSGSASIENIQVHELEELNRK